jgi:homocysteine S-methyltransferase
MSPSWPEPKVTILDGGLGTTLSLPPYNITFTPKTPLWSSHLLTSPPLLSTLLAIQQSFVEAGAQILLTDTYQASHEGFRRTPGWDDKNGNEDGEVERCMRSAVSVSRKAFEQAERRLRRGRGDEGEKRGTVALSLGPYGATMVPGQEYSGIYNEGMREVAELEAWHLRRLQAFMPLTSSNTSEKEQEDREKCWQDIDLIAFETIPLLKEVTAIRKALGSLPSSLTKPFWIACVFPGDSYTLPDGTTIKTLVKTMLQRREGEAIPRDIGFNCTKITKVVGVLKEFEEAVKEMIENGEVDEWPGLVLYPDGTDGEVYNTSTMEWEQRESGSEVC